MPKLKGRAARWLLTLALTLAAAPALAGPADHCALLTQAEVEELVGRPLEPGDSSPMGCAWVPKGKSLSYLTVRLDDKKGTARQSFGSQAEDITIEEIKGLGDDAAMNIRGKNVLNLVAQKKGKQVLFNCPFLGIKTGTPDLEELKALMQKALNRL